MLSSVSVVTKSQYFITLTKLYRAIRSEQDADALQEDQIEQSLQESQVIRSSQHGFLPIRSCLTNLLIYLEYVKKNVDERAPVEAIYLNFIKALDSVLHEWLMMKMFSV